MKNFSYKNIFKKFWNYLILFPVVLGTYFVVANIFENNNLLAFIADLKLDIFVGLLLISTGYLIRYFRWRIILSSLGFSPQKNIEFKIWLGSYSLTATPGKLGEFSRCFFLKKVFKIPISASSVSIILERSFDLVAVLLLVLVAIFLNFHINNFINIKNLLSAGFIISCAFLIRRFINKEKIIFYFKKNNKKIKIYKLIENIFELKNIRNILYWKNFLQIILLSLISWSLEGLAFFMLLLGSEIKISYLSATLLHTLAGLIGALSMLPGGLVSTEFVTVTIMKSQEIPLATAVPLTFIMRLMTLWYITTLGILSLFLVRKKIFFINSNN